jgi:ADP-ribosylglycohydrolase
MATCEAIVARAAVDAEGVAAHFLRWFTAGRIRGIGASTLKAMRDLAAGTHWSLAGARGEYAAGNGAAMRIAPLAFLLNPGNPGERTVIRDVCHITHNNDEAYVGALAVVLAIRAVLAGTWTKEYSFLDAVVRDLPDSAVRDRVEQLLPLSLQTSEIAIRFGASGYVVDTVPLALYCAQLIAAHPLSEVLSQAVEAGGDTDTIASIAGQVAGCVVGSSGIPREHLAPIKDSEEVTRVGERFAEFVVGISSVTTSL